MSAQFPDLTVFIGPQSRHGLAVNLAVRDHRPAMIRAGLNAHPTRLASPALRSLVDPAKTLAERRASFDALAAEGPSFYSALNFLGAPQKGFRHSELFPEAESQLGGLAEVAGDRRFRLIIAPDALPELFLAANSDVLEERVRKTGWEHLYEIGWADLIVETHEALPGAEILVLTHPGTALGGDAFMRRLFGPAAGETNQRLFLRECLNETGKAVLDRMGEGAAPEDLQHELYRSFADRADAALCHERLGMDRLTRKLLLQRFDEDIAFIATLDRVEVI